MANTSLRNLLLANIALQTDLTEHLFSSLAHASLPQPQSRSTRPVSRARPDLEAIPSLYDNLVEATKQQAELLEHARRHQKRWRQLQRKRKQAQELEDKVDKILIELNQTGTELEELVADGQHVISNIEFAEKATFSTDDLIAYAQNLATTTSRPASLDPPAPLLSAEMLYPVESVMQSGKLAALARGEVMGILGDTEIIGTVADQSGPTVPHPGPTEGQHALAAEPAISQAIPVLPPTLAQSIVPSVSVSEAAQPVAHAPFKLDLSDSEDDD
ncbi:hypothetical protein NliqN6_4851 [Naganishia liquefaciens]|uniref:Mediator of RNA polymerase II transcription subunit 4 n=1 Tax=Naganishia liquefaciens TaxID=104408 RepID=A0A8H3YG83_9TREE|nr:hypothetical protein NliqN6_4851 [Naganishia liquefaciens]